MKKINGLDIKIYLNRVANISVTPSSLRNQGGKGLVKKTRNYFLNNSLLSKFDKNNFEILLDKQTKKLINVTKLRFGAARKSLNIFLLQSSLDRCLSKYYGLEKILDKLELPLDSFTIKHLKEAAKNKKHLLPKWQSIKKLNKRYNKKFQQFAEIVAQGERIPRAYLDLLYWRKQIEKKN